jgi:hypothetical protein
MRRGLIIFIGLFAAWLLTSAAKGKVFPQTTAYNRATPVLTTTRTWDYGMRLRCIANVVDGPPEKVSVNSNIVFQAVFPC